MKVHALSVLAVSAVVSLSGCGGDAETASPGATPSPAATTTPSAPSPSASAPAPSPSTPPPVEGQSIDVSFVGGEVTGDTGRIDVPVGETVTVTITSDVADEAHLHGYDVRVDVVPGTPATLTFEATIPGIYELELENLGKQLLSVQVA